MGAPADNVPGIHAIGGKTAARLLSDGRRLENIPADEPRPAWTTQWPQVVRWREMIRLDTKTALPDSLLTTAPAAPLPTAAHVLEELLLQRPRPRSSSTTAPPPPGKRCTPVAGSCGSPSPWTRPSSTKV